MSHVVRLAVLVAGSPRSATPWMPRSINPEERCGTTISSDHYPRDALGIDKSIDILHYIRDLPTPEDRAAAVAKVQAVERRAMLEQQPQPGLVKLMDYLQSRGLRRALCTRNFESVRSFLS